MAQEPCIPCGQKAASRVAATAQTEQQITDAGPQRWRVSFPDGGSADYTNEAQANRDAQRRGGTVVKVEKSNA